jgi:hypothetical protein
VPVGQAIYSHRYTCRVIRRPEAGGKGKKYHRGGDIGSGGVGDRAEKTHFFGRDGCFYVVPFTTFSIHCGTLSVTLHKQGIRVQKDPTFAKPLRTGRIELNEYVIPSFSRCSIHDFYCVLRSAYNTDSNNHKKKEDYFRYYYCYCNSNNNSNSVRPNRAKVSLCI